MEKNTVLAIVLSAAVMIGYFFLQRYLNPPKPETAAVSQTEVTVPSQAVSVQAQPSPQPISAGPEAPPPPAIEEPQLPSPAEIAIRQAEESVAQIPLVEERVIIETDLFSAVLSNIGGDIVSLKLNKHNDKDSLVEMVLSGDKEAHAFTVSFDSIENILEGRSSTVSSLFYVNRISEYSVEFYQNFVIPGVGSNEPSSFKLIKRYEFRPGEYMFELNISLDGGYSARGYNFNGVSYTLGFGPQIGPGFAKLDQRTEYRQYLTYTNNKVRQEKLGVINREMPPWAAIAGKYFALIAIPYTPQYRIAFSGQGEEGIPAASRLFISRADYSGSRLDDRYLFYAGPKDTEILNTYYNGKNGFQLNGLQIAEAAKTRSLFSIPPLERILKTILLMCYEFIPNYGVAIILLTLLVKIIFFPLTKKSSESTLRMQKLAPRIKEIQTKFKDNPQKMNAEMAEFYKQEGYNPLSGCLPMLLQIPIFFAMYNLFNSHFDLRGAMFIPGWIPDLSVPEIIWTFPDGFRVPLLGWTALRLLPFIYVGSQLLYGRVTQTPDQQSNPQMKIMLYVMPIAFFFILYDVPSGLLIYWIFSNLLTLVQQVVITKIMIPMKAAQMKAAQKSQETVIAPPPKKNKKGR